MAKFYLRDYRTRIYFKNFEIQQKVLKSLMVNSSLSIFARRKLCVQFMSLGSRTSFSFLKNSCIFSGRSRSMYSFFNLSRLCNKEFFKAKFLPNLRKSSW